MLRLLAAEPNVLLLDEPTNDLDTDTLASLEDLLDSWPGTMIVASHDRYLIERVTDTVYGMFGDGRLVHLPGGVDEYLARASGSTPSTPIMPTGPAPAASSGMSAADLRTAKKELAKLERQLGKLEQKEAQLNESLAVHGADYDKIVELDGQLRATRDERGRVEEAWLELAEQLSTD
jgi:energy-coupling factor transporter ATP-binding protein EcfA2